MHVSQQLQLIKYIYECACWVMLAISCNCRCMASVAELHAILSCMNVNVFCNKENCFVVSAVFGQLIELLCCVIFSISM